MDPALLGRVDIEHIDQLAARVLDENTAPGRGKQRVYDHVALNEMRQLLAELDDRRWEPEFLLEEWEQVILGQSVPTRSAYFQARRAGRGRALTRPERNHIWKLIEQFTARLDKLGVETWGQASERAARFEIERAAKIKSRRAYKEEIGGKDLIHRDNSSGMRYLGYRYQHIVVDEAQDLSPAHWKMLRAMVDPDLANDMFIAGDTHQRIYDHQVTLASPRHQYPWSLLPTDPELPHHPGDPRRGHARRRRRKPRTTTSMTAPTTSTATAPSSTVPPPRSSRTAPGTTRSRQPRQHSHHVARGDHPPTRTAPPSDPSGPIAVCVADRDMASRGHVRPGHQGRHHHGGAHQGRPEGRRRGPRRHHAPFQGTRVPAARDRRRQ